MKFDVKISNEHLDGVDEYMQLMARLEDFLEHMIGKLTPEEEETLSNIIKSFCPHRHLFGVQLMIKKVEDK